MPEFVHLMNAQMLLFGSGAPQSLTYQEFLVPTVTIAAYHMLPPGRDPVDYDESEPNRKMEPCTLLIGTFKMHGYLRMASQLHLAKSLEVGRTSFLSLYDVEISNPTLPNLGVMRVPMMLFRPTMVCFGLKIS